MTARMCYHTAMILLSVQIRGAVWTAALLIALIVAVHLVKLAVIGYKNTKAPPQPPPQPAAPEKQPAAIYYIVEKKRTRKKKEQLGDPKEISFK